jgi:predicted dehydrogenase
MAAELDDSNSNNKLGVGIIGCARIAKKNCVAAASNPFASCRITAISSRSEDKARAFVNEVFTGIEQRPTQIFSGADAYDKLLKSKESCDAVYIPLPTKLHDAYVGSALRNKKHVLLEKPVAVSAQSYRDMLSIASQEGRFLMDGTMFVRKCLSCVFGNNNLL